MILDDIIFEKKKTLEARLTLNMTNPIGKIAQQMKGPRLFVIGEIKKASPSKGVLIADFDPIRLARQYMDAKVDAISILSEEHYFQGKIQYVKDVAKITSIPILRKDFIIDVREIIEAKQAGASLILLIVAILDDAKLREFYQVAYALGLECIVEVHNEEEVQRALLLSPQIIGINNRNLQTFQVNLATSLRLRPLIPKDIVVISESGIHTKEDMKTLQNIGVDGVLIGESFMRSSSICTHMKELIDDDANED